MNREKKFTVFMIRQYVSFLSTFNLSKEDFNLDLYVLADVSKRYFKDVDRLHQYHGITRINAHKIGGYTSYWISKLRPISVTNPDLYRDKSGFVEYINEIFALRLATSRICATNRTKTVRLTGELMKSLLYLMKYRVTSGDNLALMYYFFDHGN